MIKEITVNKEFIQEMNKHREATPEQKEKGLLYASSENIILFAEKMLGIKLYSWQVLVLHDFQVEVFRRKVLWNEIYEKTKELDEHGIDIEFVEVEDDIYLTYTLDDKIHEVKVDIPSPTFVDLTSRQIGKSTEIAISTLWSCIYNHIPATLDNNTTVGIVSAGDQQAKKLLKVIKNMLVRGNKKMAKYKDPSGNPAFGKTFFDDLIDENEDNNKEQMTFKSYEDKFGILLKGSTLGSTIKSYPPTAKVLGETFSYVIVDEAAKTAKISDEFHDDELLPTGSSTFAIYKYASTPWSPAGFFYNLVDPEGERDVPEGTHIYPFSIEAIALEDPVRRRYIQQKFIDNLLEQGKNESVQRGFYIKFIKGETQFLDPKHVSNTFKEELEECYGSDLQVDIGIDWGGKTTSETSINVTNNDEESGISTRLFEKRFGVNEDDKVVEYIAMLREIFPNVRKIISEDCPKAEYKNTEMKDKGWEVIEVNPRAEKVKKYFLFRARQKNELIQSYPDKNLKKEMMVLEYDKSRANSYIGAPKGYSDDSLDSFMYSCYPLLNDIDNSTKAYDWKDNKSSGGILSNW